MQDMERKEREEMEEEEEALSLLAVVRLKSTAWPLMFCRRKGVRGIQRDQMRQQQQGRDNVV